VAGYFRLAEERPALTAAARAADAAIAVAATILGVVAEILHVRSEGPSIGVFISRAGSHSVVFWPREWPSAWLLLGLALTTAPLAFRRIYPITAFFVILAAVLSTSHDATAIQFVSVVFAAYSAVAYSPFGRLSLLSVLTAAVYVTATNSNTSPPVPARYTALLIILPTVAVGTAIRTWRRRAGESAERLRLAQAEHEAQTARAIELERARIAAEMHDVVTHNVSVMVVQAGAARRVLDSSPEQARQALLAVEAVGRTAMTELRHLLGLLNPSSTASADQADFSPQPDLGQIGYLVDRVRAAGLPVELSVTGRRDLSPGLDLVAYRVVQEAITNVLKHAGQARTTVRVEAGPRELLITVCDDGRPPGSPAPDLARSEPAGSGGRGLIGLRERIAVYRGELDADPRPGGGWRLVARIPLEPVTGPDGDQAPDRTGPLRAAPT
jgi:signal transduction histidine kinase